MSNCFTQTTTQGSISTVNKKKPNIFGNVQVDIGDIKNLQSTLDTLSTGGIAMTLSQLNDVAVSNSQNNQQL